MNFVTCFLQSDWLKNAAKYAYNPKRLKALVLQLGFYLSKNGSEGLKVQAKLMYNYLKDVVTGRYEEYNMRSLTFIIAATIYLLAPVDLIPDVLLLGLADDMAIIAWALNVSADELKRYKKSIISDKNNEIN